MNRNVKKAQKELLAYINENMPDKMKFNKACKLLIAYQNAIYESCKYDISMELY